MGRIRQINGHVIYFPGPAEDTGNLIAATCNEICLARDICGGDYLVLDTKLKPEIGNFVSYKGTSYRLELNEDGQPILKNGHNTILPPSDDNYDGVVVQINRKLRGEI